MGTAYTFIDSAAETTGFSITKNASNFLVFRAGATNRITGATAMTTGAWHHVAVTRSGSSIKMFLNGAQQGSTYTATTSYVGGSYTFIGSTQAAAQVFSGFMDELRVLNGSAAWTAAFTVPAAAYTDALEFISGGDYQALFHFDGVDASTTLTDASGGHTFTAQNGAQIDTAQFKFGTSSLLFDGTNDYVRGDGSSNFAFGTGDFTIDFWARFNSVASDAVLFDSGPNFSGPINYIMIWVDEPTPKLKFFTTGSNAIVGTTTMTTGTWHHIALTRRSGSTRLFLNGVQEGSTYADTNDYQCGPTIHPFLGQQGDGSGLFFNGWLDELRVIKGTALWASTFAVPTRAAVRRRKSGARSQWRIFRHCCFGLHQRRTTWRWTWWEMVARPRSASSMPAICWCWNAASRSMCSTPTFITRGKRQCSPACRKAAIFSGAC